MSNRSLPRQKNVQQQNLEVEHRIRSEATYWRAKGIPAALREIGEVNGIDWLQCIVVDLDIDFPGMPQLFGLLVTGERRFIRFAIDTDDKHQVVESVSEWVDVTEEQNMNPHNPGVGVGFGALAVKVLDELRNA